MSADARPVRAGEQLDWVRVAAYLRDHLPTDRVPGLDLSHDMQVGQFHGGHSNLTYLVRYGDVELVLRRPPLGPLPPTAHDMAREHRWLEAIHPLFPLAPRPYLLCEDPAIAGAPFYVMERRRGLIVRADEPPQLHDQTAERRRVSRALVEMMAGSAERALEAMCRRVKARVAFGKPLAEQGIIREGIAESRMEIERSRLLTLKAAQLMDTVGNKAARREIAMIKVVVPRMATRVIDRAIQAHGAAGVSDDFGLAAAWAHARTIRLADGPDEVHVEAIAKMELK